MRECFCFGSEAVNASGEAVRGLVKRREFHSRLRRSQFLAGFAREKYDGSAAARPLTHPASYAGYPRGQRSRFLVLTKKSAASGYECERRVAAGNELSPGGWAHNSKWRIRVAAYQTLSSGNV